MLDKVQETTLSAGGGDVAAFSKVAVVIDYPASQSAADWARDLVPSSVPHVALVGTYGPSDSGLPKVDTLDWAACARSNSGGLGIDAMLIVRHPAMDAEEVEMALSTLAQAKCGVHFTIPGLNELNTADQVALFAIDTRKGSVLPKTPLGARMRRWAVPRLPVSIKHPIRQALVKIGLSNYFGLSPELALKPGDEAVRISNTSSVGSVLRVENPTNLPSTFSLGSTRTQEAIFVKNVAGLRPYPRYLNIVLSNQCNLECTMCPFHSPLFREARTTEYFDAKKYIGLDMIKKMIADLRAIKPDDQPIGFHMGELDEPALHPKLAEIVRLLAEIPNSTVHITSNGNIFNEKLARAVILNGVKSMQFSVDAQKAETYHKIRGGKLEKVQRNVKRFLDLREELGREVSVNICIIDQDGAHDEIDDFKAYWREAGATSVSVYRLFKPDAKDPAKWVVPSKYFEENARTPCTAAWDQCFVYPDGEISLCCTTLIRVPQEGVISKGNLKTQTLGEVWLGYEYQKLRTDLINNDLKDHKYCADCDNWSSSYQFMKIEQDGTKIVYGESMAFHYFPENQ